MSILLHGDHLEQELAPEPVMAPAASAVALHCGLVLAIVLYGIIGGFFRHNLWGGAGPGGAIQVNLVSSALPIPSDHPPNQNVLATETPSEAPAQPQPKAKQAIDETAIPITGKQKKPEHQEAPKTPPRKAEPTPTNRAQYGEQAGTNLPRQTTGTSGPAMVDQSSFGNINQSYVDQINRVMIANWYKPGNLAIPKGARSYIVFKISRDGSVSEQKVTRTSGNSVLDDSCVRAAQRVDRFPQLPNEYRFPYVMIDYYCEY
jgi:protein TonB